jgi:GGDEF domain-containing protein
MIPQRPDNLPTRRVLDQPVFLERVQEEIARCLRTRRHLSLALVIVRAADKTTTYGPALSPDALLGIAAEIARHIRPYDLVATSGTAELTLLFPEATSENADIILTRLRMITAAPPGPPLRESRRVWGLATWPADGADPAALLMAARRRLSAA